jgi:hypothetical protein
MDVAMHVDALTREQVLAHRERLVPQRPVREVADVAPILVVEADSSVVPLTHEVSRHLALGWLDDAPLPMLAREWIAAGRAEELAGACEMAWETLSSSEDPSAAYWYEEVAARTRPADDSAQGRAEVVAIQPPRGLALPRREPALE